MIADAVTKAVQTVCPIVGVSIGSISDKSTWRVDFASNATDAQKSAAQSVIAAFDPACPTVSMIVVERERRLALGFHYDFGDARGVHHIGTTSADMVGWGEVSTYAGALLDSGDTTTKIAVVTDTGPVEVTAPEWRAIEIAAAQFRQPIWARSFVLMQTLPVDYTADAHWA